MLELFSQLKYPFKLPALPYDFAALEPHIDATTMQIHHDKHHQTYVDKLNAALESFPDLHDKSLADLLMDTEKIPSEIRQAVINHGGGHANHSLFWEILTPNGGQEPEGELLEGLIGEFSPTSPPLRQGSEGLRGVKDFKEEFTKQAVNLFGSGWVWLLIETPRSKSTIVTTPNQNSPLMDGATPILGLDVWEHAYYLKYQNKRADYIASWWNVVNWQKVSEFYDQAISPAA